ncbi:hypothetical protein [Streptomyces sp. NPDC049585]|uniref:contact-dependent growth inhibition system immunity protein n=1 Tax=Streptomyces sp. NPDC049585 TaxID=3155154 RepID=UPI003443792D
MEFDFGLTALGEQFHMDWRYSGDTPQDVVRSWARTAGGDEGSPEEIRLLREDIQLLLASSLSDEELHALWRVAAAYYPDFPADGVEPPRGRAWLQDVDREIRPFLREPVDAAPAPRDASASAQSAVCALAERLTPQRELPLEPLPARAVIAALQRCATEVGAALAFRFLLRAYAAYESPVTADSWRTFEELNRHFGYGKFLLLTIDYLKED